MLTTYFDTRSFFPYSCYPELILTYLWLLILTGLVLPGIMQS